MGGGPDTLDPPDTALYTITGCCYCSIPSHRVTVNCYVAARDVVVIFFMKNKLGLRNTDQNNITAMKFIAYLYIHILLLLLLRLSSNYLGSATLVSYTSIRLDFLYPIRTHTHIYIYGFHRYIET
jgi:hypothetical protein